MVPNIKVRLILLSLIFTGCATLRNSVSQESLVAPEVIALNESSIAQSEDELTQLWRQNKENSKGWWAGYKLATRELEEKPQLSCEIWTHLSQESRFPLAELSLLRAYANCTDFSKLDPIPNEIPAVYKTLALEGKTKILLKSKEYRVLIEVLRERARLSEQKPEKVRLVQDAIDWAQEIESPELVTELQSQLYSYAPQLQENPAKELYLRVANELRDERNFSKAESYYNKIIADQESDTDNIKEAYKGLRQTYRIKGDKVTAMKITARWHNWSKKQWLTSKKDSKKINQYLESGLMLARAQWTEGHSDLALRTLDQVATALKKVTSLGDVYLIKARIFEERLQLERTIHWLDQALSQQLTPVTKDKVLWTKAWSLRKLKKYSAAADTLKTLSDTTLDVFDKNRFNFWLAKTFMDLGQTAEAQQLLRKLQEEDTLGFYGMMAYHELDLPFPALEKNQLNNQGSWSSRDVSLKRELRAQLDWLIVVGEGKLAGKWIESLLGNSNPKNTVWGANEVYLFTKLAESGQFLPLFSRLSYIPPELKKRFINEKLALIFPRPFYKEVQKASEKSGTPIELIYAIMRQESAFDPETRSVADAFGLMQVLPELSETYATQVGFKIQHHNELYKPEINIPLGSFVLKSLLDKYKNQYILTVSGYNANDKAVKTWLKTRYKGDPLEFIEEIPYDETRGYIKLTLRNYIYYSRIQRLGQSVPFPKVTLLGLEEFVNAL